MLPLPELGLVAMSASLVRRWATADSRELSSSSVVVVFFSNYFY